LTVSSKNRKAKLSSLAALLIGAAIYLIFKGGMVVYPILDRSLPAEYDDSYTYLSSAVIHAGCAGAPCRSVQTLRQQFSQNPQGLTTLHQNRLLSSPYLLYGYLQLILLEVFDDPDFVLNLLQIGIAAFAFVVLFFFLYTIWGAAVSGISFSLLGLFVFPNTGLNYYTPSTLAIFFALGLFTLTITKRTHARWYLLIGMVLLPLMHTVGLIFSGVLAVAYALLNKEDLSRTDLFIAIVLIAIIGVYLLNPFMISKTLIPGEAFFYRVISAEYLNAVAGNFYAAIGILKVTLKFLGGDTFTWSTLMGFWTIPFLWIGVRATPVRYRAHAILVFVLLLLACVAIIFYPLPAHLSAFNAEPFLRLWFIPTIFLIAFFSQGVLHTGTYLVGKTRESLRSASAYRAAAAKPLLSYHHSFITVLISIAVILTFFVFEFSIQSQNLRRIEGRINWRTFKADYRIDKDQPRFLAALPEISDILYPSGNLESPVSTLPLIQYFLAHGNLKHGALFHTEEISPRSKSNAELPAADYLVTWNPIERLPNIRSGGFTLSTATDINPLRIEHATSLPSSMHLNFINESDRVGRVIVRQKKPKYYEEYVNSSPELLSQYTANQSGQSKSQFGLWFWENFGQFESQKNPGKYPEPRFPSTIKSIPPGQSWILLTGIDIAGEADSLELFGPNEPRIFLSGIRVDPEAPTFWPWDSSIILKYKGPNLQRKYNKASPNGTPYLEKVTFETETLCDCSQKVVEILGDNGSTVLAKLQK